MQISAEPGSRTFQVGRLGFRALQRVTVPLRRSYYLRGRGRRFISGWPTTVRAIAGVDDEAAIGSRRLEIGGGPHAQRGYLHVDVDPGAHHLEWVAPAWAIPLPDGWATEIVAVHSLEHVHPSRLIDTLAEWRRVLRPGGRVQVHVPNGPRLFGAFIEATVAEKWPLMGSLLGMYCGPEVRDPRGLKRRSDHQLIFDGPLLQWALEAGGFAEVRDLTGTVDDRHTAGWDALVRDYSLVAEGRKVAKTGDLANRGG